MATLVGLILMVQKRSAIVPPVIVAASCHFLLLDGSSQACWGLAA
jgi:hypothetical protein